MKAYAHMEERELVQCAALGDQEAFKYLVLSYEAQLLIYLQHLLGDRENARDIAQETFIAAFYALPSWKPPQWKETIHREEYDISLAHEGVAARPLAPWLYHIATNRAFTFLKKQSKYTSLSLSEENMLSQKQDTSGGHENKVENTYITREFLREVLSFLSEEDAACIILRFALNERHTEIAEKLGLTKEAVRKRISRGIAVIRKHFSSLGGNI